MIWLYGGFVVFILALLALDLGVLHKRDKTDTVKAALGWSALWISIGVAFSGVIYLAYDQHWFGLGTAGAGQSGGAAMGAYLTGFFVEKSLAIDNIFVIAMIFSALAVPSRYQHRVLFWGILGVIVLRGLMIGFGAALVTQYHWILYFFAAFLIFTGIKMLVTDEAQVDISKNPVLGFLRRRLRVTEALHGNNFFTRLPDPQTGRLATYATPLFLALAMVEIADLIFAVDSIPAVFAITTDTFIVYTSNIFAILGLRALYFALAAIIHRFHYLKYALGVLLVFIGSKVFVADLFGLAKFPASVSLGVTFAILAAGVGWSLWKTRDNAMLHDG